MVAVVLESSEEENEFEEPEVDDAERLRMVKLVASQGARRSVACEPWSASPEWEPPVHPKTTSHRKLLEAAATKAIFFSGLPAEIMNQLVDAFAGPLRIRSRHEIITQGTDVGCDEPALFILANGKVGVYKRVGSEAHPGKEVFSTGQQGYIFGELALLYQCPRQATVIASADSTLWFINREIFNNLVKGKLVSIRARHVKFLESVEVLKGLTTDERQRIADVLQQRIFQKSDTIIRAGDDGAEFFMLEEGRAIAVHRGCALKHYGPGDYFGELALLRNQKRSVDVVADTSPTKVVALDAGSFKRLLGPLSRLMQDRAQAYTPIRSSNTLSQNPPLHEPSGGLAEWMFGVTCCKSTQKPQVVPM